MTRFRTVDLLVTVTIGAAFGVAFAAWPASAAVSAPFWIRSTRASVAAVASLAASTACPASEPDFSPPAATGGVVAVGTGHLVGPDSVQSQLAARGILSARVS